MNKHPVTLATGIILLLIFVFILFAYQVRQTEVAVVTTFGKYSSTRTEPGLYFRLPWPIQKPYRFDKRIQNFERKFEQTTTEDAKNILITVYCGWSIANPQTFLERFNGEFDLAEQSLESLVRSAKIAVIGQHPFNHLISPNEADLKFDEIEAEMLQEIQSEAESNYGIKVSILGIKQLGLPEGITKKVFERMREERQRLVNTYQGEGQARSIEIKSAADQQREEILAEAQAEAINIMGDAERKASEYYKVFDQAPELANFLKGLKTLQTTFEEKATLVVGPDTPPFDMLGGGNNDGVSSLPQLSIDTSN